jgi:hypothetical protein
VQSPYLGSPVLTPEHQSTAEPQDRAQVVPRALS